MGFRPERSNPCRGIRRYRRKGRERFQFDAELGRLAAALSAHEAELPFQLVAVRPLLLVGRRKKKRDSPSARSTAARGISPHGPVRPGRGRYGRRAQRPRPHHAHQSLGVQPEQSCRTLVLIPRLIVPENLLKRASQPNFLIRSMRRQANLKLLLVSREELVYGTRVCWVDTKKRPSVYMSSIRPRKERPKSTPRLLLK